MKYIFFTLILFQSILGLRAQNAFFKDLTFTRQDSLRGMITEERAWWDLEHYDLQVEVDIDNRIFRGSNKISYEVLKPNQVMQIDLQMPMELTSAMVNGVEQSFEREGNVYFITLQKDQKVSDHNHITVHFEGIPRRAKMPPWDGGISWTTDDNATPFVATSCQGDGASLWWPCKDHMYDEPDSMLISVTVPHNLIDVSNGKLRKIIKHEDEKNTFVWAVVNPINNYGVNVNIADYKHFHENYQGEKGALSCDYWVLSYNIEKAKEQFKQVPLMLEAFEHWFGPYPFYEDGFKLVEVPYLGMEHQSSVTYGNRYGNGYYGRDLSGTGWGLKFDFIIIHESGHEWFANNITYKDIADMWIHESFTAYSENLYLDYHFGKKAAADYVIGTRMAIGNKKPIIGPYDVNHAGSGDMYYKGANMLHMIRTILNDDEKWRMILRGLNETFYHKTVTTEEIEQYLIAHTGLDLSSIFDQYLRNIEIPKLEYYIDKASAKMYYRWNNCIDDFHMPVRIYADDNERDLVPSTEWKFIELPPNTPEEWEVDRNYYVDIDHLKRM